MCESVTKNKKVKKSFIKIVVKQGLIQSLAHFIFFWMTQMSELHLTNRKEWQPSLLIYHPDKSEYGYNLYILEPDIQDAILFLVDFPLRHGDKAIGRTIKCIIILPPEAAFQHKCCILAAMKFEPPILRREFSYFTTVSSP